MIEGARVAEKLKAHALINNMKECKKNDLKNLHLINFWGNIKCRFWCSFFTH